LLAAWLANDCARRADAGEPAPPIRLAAVIGGTLGLMVFPCQRADV
jgi:hypothetical protein